MVWLRVLVWVAIYSGIVTSANGDTVEQMREAIAAEPLADTTPMVQTDLAHRLLNPLDAQALFVAFGRPLPSERSTYLAAAQEAYHHLSDAYQRQQEQLMELPQQAEHQTKRVASGLWATMIDDYHRRRTPYLLAQAAVVLVTAEDAGLSTEQKREKAEQAEALLAMLIETLPFGAPARERSAALLTRLRLKTADSLEPVEAFEVLTEREAITDLPIDLALTWIERERSLGRLDVAKQLVEQVKQHEAVNGSPLIKAVVYDAASRLSVGVGDSMQMTDGLEAYEPLLTAAFTTALTTEQQPSFTDQVERAAVLFLGRRWRVAFAALDETERLTLPVLVRRVIAEARYEGDGFAPADGPFGVAVTKQWYRSLNQAGAGGMTDVADAHRIMAWRGEAYVSDRSRLLTDADQMTIAQKVAAIKTVVGLAADLPEQPESEKAMAWAAFAAQALFESEPNDEQVQVTYDETMRVLYALYALTEAADNHRVVYATRRLASAGRVDEAITILQGMPTNHPHAAVAASMRKRLQATQLASDGQVDRAVALLGDDVALLDLKVKLLSDAGRLNEALAAIDALMANQTGSSEQTLPVIDRVLREIDQRRTELTLRIAGEVVPEKRDEMTQERDRLSALALPLAERVYGWADEQEFAGDPVVMLPYRVMLADAYRLAGQGEEALRRLDEWSTLETNRQATVMKVRAETLFDLGSKATSTQQQQRQQQLTEAFHLYGQLIAGLQHVKGSLWWHSHMRQMQILDQLQINTQDIARQVRDLKQRVSPDLGGPPYRDIMERLEQQYR